VPEGNARGSEGISCLISQVVRGQCNFGRLSVSGINHNSADVSRKPFNDSRDLGHHRPSALAARAARPRATRSVRRPTSPYRGSFWIRRYGSLAAGRYARGECRGANIRLRGGDPDSPPLPCSRSAIPQPQKQGCRGAITGRLELGAAASILQRAAEVLFVLRRRLREAEAAGGHLIGSGAHRDNPAREWVQIPTTAFE
jgi:hypothetical protein